MSHACSRPPIRPLAARRAFLLVGLFVPLTATCGDDRFGATDSPGSEPAALPAPPPTYWGPGSGGPPSLGDAPLIVPPLFDCKPVRSDDTATNEQYAVPKPPFSTGVFPCTRCHDRPDDYNPTPRGLLLMHSNIRLVHGSREQWCYDCHNPSDRDKLRLASGRLVSFETSYELCGQCHGEKLRDWRAGVHGRRIGCWNGRRQYLLCVNCHSPHTPKYQPLHPRPRPKKPSEIRFARGSET